MSAMCFCLQTTDEIVDRLPEHKGEFRIAGKPKKKNGKEKKDNVK